MLSLTAEFHTLSNRYGSAYPYWCLVCLVPAIISTVFMTTSINLAAHSIEVDLGLVRGKSAPLMTYFLAAMAAAMACSGWLITRVGYLQSMLLACAIFAASSIAAAQSDSLTQLSGWRILQGLSAGLLQPLAMILGKKVSPTHKLGFFIGLFGAITVLTGATVPYVAGVLVDQYGWQSLFIVSVPPIAFSALMSLLFISGCGHADDGQENIFMSLLSDPAFYRPFLIMFLFGAGFFASIYLIPLFLQNVSLLGATQAGIYMTPGNILLAAAFPLFGWLSTRFSARSCTIWGLIIFCTTSGLWVVADIHTPAVLLILIIAGGRLGLGMIMPAVNLAAITGRDNASLNQASGFMSLARMLGGAAGVLCCGLLLEWQSTKSGSDASAFHLCFAFLAVLFAIALIPAWKMSRGSIAALSYLPDSSKDISKQPE